MKLSRLVRAAAYAKVMAVNDVVEWRAKHRTLQAVKAYMNQKEACCDDAEKQTILGIPFTMDAKIPAGYIVGYDAQNNVVAILGPFTE